MAERVLRRRLGVFVAAAIATLTGLIVLFGGAPTVFNARTKYTVLYPEAPGVTAGTPVRKSGVRIGRVTAIDIDESSGEVRVNIEVENKYLPRQSEEPAISRGLLSGDTAIDFIPKTDEKGQPMPRADAIPPNADIAGVRPLNTQRLLNQAQGAIPNAQDALIKFSATMSRFDAVGPKAERALDEIAAFARLARELVPELRETNKRVQDFIGADGAPDPKNQDVALRKADEPEPANLKTLVREIQDFVKTYKPLGEDLRGLLKVAEPELTAALKSLRSLTDRAGTFLTDDNRKSLTEILATFQKGSADLLSEENKKNVNAILKNVNAGSEDLTKTIRLAAILFDRAEGTLKELNGRLAEVKGVIANFDKASKPIAEGAEPIMKNIALAAENLSKTLIDARSALAAFNKADGTVGKILNDPLLYNQLVDAASNLNRTLTRAEKIAKDLEVFADKVARKPEVIGIGGALRPSTGLKESPTAPLGPTPYPYPAPGSGRIDGPLQPIAPVPGGVLQPIPPISSFQGEGVPRVSQTPIRPAVADDLPRER